MKNVLFKREVIADTSLYVSKRMSAWLIYFSSPMVWHQTVLWVFSFLWHQAGRVRPGSQMALGKSGAESTTMVFRLWPSCSSLYPRPGEKRTCLPLHCLEMVSVLQSRSCFLSVSKKSRALGRRQLARSGHRNGWHLLLTQPCRSSSHHTSRARWCPGYRHCKPHCLFLSLKFEDLWLLA